jgi:hypothetical protein
MSKINIIETDDSKIVHELFSDLDTNSLAVFDVDEVLLTPCDQSLRHKELFNQLVGELFLAKEITVSDTTEYLAIIGAMFDKRAAMPVDRSFVDLIQTLQNKQIKVVALTNAATGKMGAIDSMKDWRLTELRRLGYEFATTWPNVPEKQFLQLATKEPGVFPVFSQGVLLTNGIPKGTVLEAFFDMIEEKTNRILFIDDNREYLESVGEAALKMGCTYLGIHYKGAELLNRAPFNKDRAVFQIKTLFQEKIWLSDQEADAKM